jgi:glycerol-3-phosphate dehydrogenase
MLTGQQQEIRGKIVVNATGAWSSHIGKMEPDATHCKPSPTKGVHLIVPKLIETNQALLLRAPQDGRVFFILPWGEFSMIGTTDTFYEGDLDHVTVDAADIDYLLSAVNEFFPEKPLTGDMIISSFAGLRPLVSQDDSRPSAILREHVIQTSEGGLITLLGGKFTTHRLVAEQVVDQIVEKLKINSPSITKHLPLPGASGPYSLAEVKDKLRSEDLSDDVVVYLLSTYGTSSMRILEIMKKDPQNATLLHEDFPHTYAELIYAIDVEHVRTFEDWLHRSAARECFSKHPHYEDAVTKQLQMIV